MIQLELLLDLEQIFKLYSMRKDIIIHVESHHFEL